MNRGVDRQPIFFDDCDRIDFGAQLAECYERFGSEILAYCLMGNHYHLLVRTPGGELSAVMQRLGLTYTRHVNDRLGRDGPLFRGRYHSVLVESDEYLMWATRYIHRNPIALRWVTSLDRYRWSSYRAYLGLRRRPRFVTTDPVLALFGNDQRRYRSFNEAPSTPHLAWSYDGVRQLVSFACSNSQLESGDGTSAGRLERTILLLARDALGSTELATRIGEGLTFPSRRAEVTALERARASADRPAVRSILRMVLDELIGEATAA